MRIERICLDLTLGQIQPPRQLAHGAVECYFLGGGHCLVPSLKVLTRDFQNILGERLVDRGDALSHLVGIDKEIT